MFFRWCNYNIFTGFCKRLTWIAVSLCCLVGLIVNAYIIINDYASYQTEPALAYEPSRRLGFPAVTLCNLNAIKKSLLSREGALENVTETEPDSDSSTLADGASDQTRKKRGVGNGRGLGNGNSRGPGRGLGHGRGRGRNDDDDEPTPTEYENLTTPTFQPPDDDMVAHIGYRRKGTFFDEKGSRKTIQYGYLIDYSVKLFDIILHPTLYFHSWANNKGFMCELLDTKLIGSELRFTRKF